MRPYLDADKLIVGIETLSGRIHERFPQSGLSNVSMLLLDVAKQAKERAEWISGPIVVLQLGVAALISLFIGFLIWSWFKFAGSLDDTLDRSVDVIVAVDASISVFIVFGVGIIFLVTLGIRIRRVRALKAIHELRSIAHLIDMHQLSKDPERILQRGKLTSHSTKLNMSSFEMSRYLDYCSELLAMTGKVGALYAQSFNDSVVVAAVTEIEQLTTALSRKIWQKLMILHTLRGVEPH